MAPGREPADVAQDGEEQSGLLRVSAALQRNDIERVRQLFATLLLDQLPQAIRGLVEGVCQARPGRHYPAADRAVRCDHRKLRGHYVPQQDRADTPTTQADGPPPGNGVRATLPTGCPDAIAAEFGYGSGERDDRPNGS